MSNSPVRPVVGGQQEGQPVPMRHDEDRPARPEETVCIAVDKVFDFCYHEEVCTRTLDVGGAATPAGTPVACQLHAAQASCQVVGETQQGENGLAKVTLMVSVPATLQVGTQPPRNFNFVCFKSLQLNLPQGARLECQVTGTCVCGLVDLNGDGFAEEAFCQANLVVVVETTGRVRLLVPSYGYCTPVLSREAVPARPPEGEAGSA